MAIRNKVMPPVPEPGLAMPDPAIAGLVPQDPHQAPRRVRALHKALLTGMRGRHQDRV